MAGTARPADREPSFTKPRFLLTDRPAEPFRKRLAMLKNERTPHEGDWREISQNIRPTRGLWTAEEQRRRKSASSIINNTPLLASRTLGAGMMSGITSPARPWFRLTTGDPARDEAAGVKMWLHVVTRRIQHVLASSNFYTSRQQIYPDVGDYGTGVVIIDDDFENIVRFTVLPVGQYWLGTDKNDRVDTVYRAFGMTVLQLVRKFGYENCSQTVRDMYDRSQYDQMVKVIHAIEPNLQQVRGIKGPRGMPYVCVYFEEENGEDKLLSFKGYRDLRIAAPRWDVQAGEVYGVGPGWYALPDAKGLQVLERRKAQAIDRMVTPPTQSPAGLTGVNWLPGANTVVPTNVAQGSAAIRPIYEQRADGITAIRGEIDATEQRVNSAYYADLFLMLSQSDRREITAREIEERHEEKLLALGPVLERQHNEDLNINIDAVFNRLVDVSKPMWAQDMDGVIPPPPKELADVELKVEYVSILAQAQRAVTVGGIERLVGFTGNLAGVKPEVLDKIDFDQAIDEYADAIGTPPAVVRSDEAVKQIRDQNAAAMQQQQAAAAMPAAAQSAKLLSEARTSDGGSILDQVLGVNQ
ncbi:portal protein [Microvirga mediterraneensis]|uniref:Head-tail connector protein n=1 Tax=Microvirga mediterraneensis TaxID=2754695 RepID=A0A838BWC4_9HYPH|nr:portal protein [Microvirga mediterraneensis]MBA1159379.1 head-tail connector protein [Microvirga mediterraneensis]